jgi:branched-chain amino acid aminotransferase
MMIYGWIYNPFQAVEKIPANLLNSAHSLDELSLQLPAGAYTTFITFEKNKALAYSLHLSRLEETSKLSGYEVIINREAFNKALSDLVNSVNISNLKIRLILDFKNPLKTIYILAEPVQFPPEDYYLKGVDVQISHLERMTPEAKKTDFIQASHKLREILQGRLNEAVMVNENGELLEGLSSNFFGVINGVVQTASSGILEGITRRLVIDEIVKHKIPIRYAPIKIQEIGSLDEAFITSTSRFVLPIRKMDDIVIGEDIPGTITKQVMNFYKLGMQSELETI